MNHRSHKIMVAVLLGVLFPGMVANTFQECVQQTSGRYWTRYNCLAPRGGMPLQVSKQVLRMVEVNQHLITEERSRQRLLYLFCMAEQETLIQPGLSREELREAGQSFEQLVFKITGICLKQEDYPIGLCRSLLATSIRMLYTPSCAPYLNEQGVQLKCKLVQLYQELLSQESISTRQFELLRELMESVPTVKHPHDELIIEPFSHLSHEQRTALQRFCAKHVQLNSIQISRQCPNQCLWCIYPEKWNTIGGETHMAYPVVCKMIRTWEWAKEIRLHSRSDLTTYCDKTVGATFEDVFLQAANIHWYSNYTLGRHFTHGSPPLFVPSSMLLSFGTNLLTYHLYHEDMVRCLVDNKFKKENYKRVIKQYEDRLTQTLSAVVGGGEHTNSGQDVGFILRRYDPIDPRIRRAFPWRLRWLLHKIRGIEKKLFKRAAKRAKVDFRDYYYGDYQIRPIRWSSSRGRSCLSMMLQGLGYDSASVTRIVEGIVDTDLLTMDTRKLLREPFEAMEISIKTNGMMCVLFSDRGSAKTSELFSSYQSPKFRELVELLCQILTEEETDRQHLKDILIIWGLDQKLKELLPPEGEISQETLQKIYTMMQDIFLPLWDKEGPIPRDITDEMLDSKSPKVNWPLLRKIFSSRFAVLPLSAFPQPAKQSRATPDHALNDSPAQSA